MEGPQCATGGPSELNHYVCIILTKKKGSILGRESKLTSDNATETAVVDKTREDMGSDTAQFPSQQPLHDGAGCINRVGLTSGGRFSVEGEIPPPPVAITSDLQTLTATKIKYTSQF
jgi:hypothetical protein